MARHTDNHWLETIAVTGVPVTSGGGGTQYTEDAAAAVNPVGNMAIARRKDTLSGSEVSADGDNIALNSTSKGELYVKQTDTVPVAGDVASAATDSGNPVKIGGKYNATPPTFTDGQRGDLQLGNKGYVRTELYGVGSTTGASSATSGADAVTNSTAGINMYSNNRVYNGATWDRMPGDTIAVKTEQRFSYTHIAAGQATTTVKSGAGFLHSITFNGAATATNVTTVYDSTTGSGSVIAVPAATTATIPTTLKYDVSFATGLTILTATANGADMTVSYR